MFVKEPNHVRPSDFLTSLQFLFLCLFYSTCSESFSTYLPIFSLNIFWVKTFKFHVFSIFVYHSNLFFFHDTLSSLVSPKILFFRCCLIIFFCSPALSPVPLFCCFCCCFLYLLALVFVLLEVVLKCLVSHGYLSSIFKTETLKS